MAKTPTKSSEAVIASAEAETAPGALSAAAETTKPETDPLGHDADGKKGGTKAKAGPSAEDRIAELEADIAFLRKQFGWPKRST